MSQLGLLMHVAFSHPPGPDWDGSLNSVQRLRLLFTDQTKVVTSAGGQNSVTQMIGSLLDAVEEQYGRFPTRLYRAFRNVARCRCTKCKLGLPMVYWNPGSSVR